MNQFIGRQTELEGLRNLLKKKTASLAVIKGRRRIGKSRLAEEFTRFFLESYLLTGIPPEKGVSAQDQRDEFARQMKRLGIPAQSQDDWGDLLTDLAEHCKKGRVLVVFDEITWMGGLDPTFLPKLKTIWDTHLKRNLQLVLLLTGSNSAWIDANILSSTGFLGRISYQLHLKELPLSACSEFWGIGEDQIASYEKLKVLSVTGGVPRYLEEIRSDLSAEQNILDLCYRPTGLLFNEFDSIFSDLFNKRSVVYKNIVGHISKGNRTLSAIAREMGRSKGGDFSKYLDDLVEAGFLSRDAGWNPRREREERLGHYRISDNYVRFYIKYIEPYKHRIQSGNMQSLPKGWLSIIGLQFENLVCSNSLALFRHLKLASDDVIWSGPYIQTSNTRRQGCQIDYLIQTKHRVLYLCEVKFSGRELPNSVIKDVRTRAQNLKVPRGFSLRHVLIHVNGVAERIE